MSSLRYPEHCLLWVMQSPFHISRTFYYVGLAWEEIAQLTNFYGSYPANSSTSIHDCYDDDDDDYYLHSNCYYTQHYCCD